MLSADQRELINEETEAQWAIIRGLLEEARNSLELIRVLKACLANDDTMKLRLASNETRGEQCTAESGIHAIHGVERLSK
jgi:hypothetical protein